RECGVAGWRIGGRTVALAWGAGGRRAADAVRPGAVVIRGLLAGDHEVARRKSPVILDRQPGIRVEAEAADGRRAVELEGVQQPDVALVDMRMPGMDGLEVTEELAGTGVVNPVPVVIITTFDLDEYVHGALRRGACGFLLKRSGLALLVEAVRAAHN